MEVATTSVVAAPQQALTPGASSSASRARDELAAEPSAGPSPPLASDPGGPSTCRPPVRRAILPGHRGGDRRDPDGQRHGVERRRRSRSGGGPAAACGCPSDGPDGRRPGGPGQRRADRVERRRERRPDGDAVARSGPALRRAGFHGPLGRGGRGWARRPWCCGRSWIGRPTWWSVREGLVLARSLGRDGSGGGGSQSIGPGPGVPRAPHLSAIPWRLAAHRGRSIVNGRATTDRGGLGGPSSDDGGDRAGDGVVDPLEAGVPEAGGHDTLAAGHLTGELPEYGPECESRCGKDRRPARAAARSRRRSASGATVPARRRSPVPGRRDGRRGRPGRG